MFDVLNRASQILIGVGKVGDLFSGRGLTRSVPVGHWTALFAEVTGMLKKVPRGLIFAGLDVLESNAAQSATALHDFDRRLPGLLEQLRPGDLLRPDGRSWTGYHEGGSGPDTGICPPLGHWAEVGTWGRISASELLLLIWDIPLWKPCKGVNFLWVRVFSMRSAQGSACGHQDVRRES